MGLLTLYQQKELALAHGKIFAAVCDEKNCDRCIPAGSLYVVVKWQKDTGISGGVSYQRRIPKLIRCMDCQARKEGREPGESKKIVKVRGKKKRLSVDEAKKLVINPVIRRAALSLLKKAEESVTTEELISKLRKKKALRLLKQREFTRTLRSMKTLKQIKRREKAWTI